MDTEEVELSVDLVRRLVAGQFAPWAELDVEEVSSQGWDNRTFRLGRDLSVRLPSAEGYAPQVDREQRWLPYLARSLPLPIPEPIAQGTPTSEFSRPWSVYRWLEGTPLNEAGGLDLDLLAVDLASFLLALEAVRVPPDAPLPESSNGFRGARFERYLADGHAAVSLLDRPVQEHARRWLDEAVDSTWSSPPVWVHGDVAAGNLLVRDGRLGAVIDFGCMAVGDPACDLTIAWTVFDEPSRATFRQQLDHDQDTWRRARGWAVWKAAITLRSEPEGSAKHDDARRAIDELMTC